MEKRYIDGQAPNNFQKKKKNRLTQNGKGKVNL